MLTFGDMAFWGIVIFNWIASYWDDFWILYALTAGDLFSFGDSFQIAYTEVPAWFAWFITKTALNVLGWLIIAPTLFNDFEQHVKFTMAFA